MSTLCSLGPLIPHKGVLLTPFVCSRLIPRPPPDATQFHPFWAMRSPSTPSCASNPPIFARQLTRCVKTLEICVIERKRSRFNDLVWYELCSLVVFVNPVGCLATARLAYDHDILLRLGRSQEVADLACRAAELLLSH